MRDPKELLSNRNNESALLVARVLYQVHTFRSGPMQVESPMIPQRDIEQKYCVPGQPYDDDALTTRLINSFTRARALQDAFSLYADISRSLNFVHTNQGSIATTLNCSKQIHSRTDKSIRPGQQSLSPAPSTCRTSKMTWTLTSPANQYNSVLMAQPASKREW